MSGTFVKGVNRPSGETVEVDVGSAAGGSGTRFVVVGPITASELLAGPKAVFTPDPGEAVLGCAVLDFDPTDTNSIKILSLVVGQTWALSHQNGSTGNDAFSGNLPAQTTPVKATIFPGDPTIPGGWKANHVFNNGDCIIVNDFSWTANPGGATGATQPDFVTAQETWENVTDNAVTWNPQGGVPVEGSITVGFLVGVT